MLHPEFGDELNEFLAPIAKQETVDVWCKGCADFRPVNQAYAKYLQGEIESCSKCRS